MESSTNTQSKVIGTLFLLKNSFCQKQLPEHVKNCTITKKSSINQSNLSPLLDCKNRREHVQIRREGSMNFYSVLETR
jgi:hypothetical protein